MPQNGSRHAIHHLFINFSTYGAYMKAHVCTQRVIEKEREIVEMVIATITLTPVTKLQRSVQLLMKDRRHAKGALPLPDQTLEETSGAVHHQSKELGVVLQVATERSSKVMISASIVQIKGTGAIFALASKNQQKGDQKVALALFQKATQGAEAEKALKGAPREAKAAKAVKATKAAKAEKGGQVEITILDAIDPVTVVRIVTDLNIKITTTLAFMPYRSKPSLGLMRALSPSKRNRSLTKGRWIHQRWPSWREMMILVANEITALHKDQMRIA